MASGTLCQLCGRPSGDQATACVTCAQRATQALRQASEWLADDLVTATTRQTALGGGRSGGKPTKASEAPLPLDLRASEALAVLRNTLSGWVRVIADDHHGSHPTNTVKAMAKWLIPVIGWARGQDYGPELIDEVQAAVAQALAAVDRPGPNAYLGQCPTCDHPIYGNSTRPVAQCRNDDCEGSVDVASWREWMWEAKGDTQAGATRLAALLARLGITVSASTIRMWAKRGKLTAVDRDGADNPLYRLGDVLDLAAKAGKVIAAA